MKYRLKCLFKPPIMKLAVIYLWGKILCFVELTYMLLFVYVWWTYEHTASSSKVKMV